MFLRAAYLLIVGVLLPLLAIQSDRVLRRIPFPPRRQIWSSVLITQLLLLGIALLTAHRSGFKLFPVPDFPVRELAAAAVLLAAILLLIPIGDRFLPPHQLDRLLKLAPRARKDLPFWLALSTTAGIAEEFAYRGVLTSVLFDYIRPHVPSDFAALIPAAILSAAAFAITHVIQGLLAAAVIFVFALAFQALVWYTQDLYSAMAVHALYDLCAGLYLAFIVRKRHPELATDEDLAGPPRPARPPT